MALKESRYNVWVARPPFHYVYNGISGSLLKLGEDDYAGVRSFVETGSSACAPHVLEQLVRGSMLVPDDVDERDRLARRYAASRASTNGLALTLVTSLGCNFDCPYCFEAKHPSIMGEQIQAAVLRLVDAQIADGLRALSITWFGGEPLVGRKPLIKLSRAFIERCEAASVQYEAAIITNGYLLTEATCRNLRDARVGFAQVTLDGPAEIHDRMRPLANGRGSFKEIVANLHHAVEYMAVGLRVNLDRNNVVAVEELFRILADEGLGGKMTASPGQLVGIDDDSGAPSAKYRPACLKNAEFASVEREFYRLAVAYGFGDASLPRPAGAPCTAVRANEFVVGSKGELYKCWESVGNPKETIGHIDDWQEPGTRANKWLQYDPFADAECRTCIALPVCMGGCAHHALDRTLYENRCGTFRHTYHDQVLEFVAARESGAVADPGPGLDRRMETR